MRATDIYGAGDIRVGGARAPKLVQHKNAILVIILVSYVMILLDNSGSSLRAHPYPAPLFSTQALRHDLRSKCR